MARITSVIAVLLVALLVCAAVGCSPGSSALEGTTWRLVGWSVSSLNPSEFTITATFADGQVSGSSGVNSYGGTCAIGPGGSFEAGDIASTLMAGSEDATRAESAYLELLRQARSFEVAGEQLTLFDEGGNESLIFELAAR